MDADNKLDEEIIQEVLRMGFGKNKLIESLQNRIQNNATVAYYLLLDNRSLIFTSYLGGEFQESKEASRTGFYPEVDIHGLPQDRNLRPQLQRQKQWLVGLQVLRVLQELSVRWKKMGHYNMKCLWIHGFQNPTLRV
ncbi:SNF1-related kinase catalytic subunit alpha KIN10-like [Olea europaea subsp. europaea]|uniref:SNF1-related kinase catalytic subunit alpha KIN10-like n=1 Tax=Olea europaea subsp. europaea TaxID=158383 RepID=A0A8S0TW01_OLEEU|nr:SNF1-related kinase catalytic subunit alpha KIN10-like [Olea europaea subsp. europaea]